MATTPSGLTILPAVQLGGAERALLVRRASLLARVGLLWHLVEAAIAVGAGAAAGSFALIGFGADSLVEALAGLAVLWRFAPARSGSQLAERRAQQLVGGCFFALAAYIGVEASRSVALGDHPGTSWIGIGLAAFTLVTMPPLASAKERLGVRLGSAATRSEGRQNLLCAYLSGALLLGLVGNAFAGLWWADPAVALLIALVAIKEGRDAWRGRGCDCCVP